MNLIDYGRLLVRRGWITVVLAVLAAGAAYVISTQINPVYRASQLVLIVPNRNDLGLTDATQRLMNSYVVYLRSSSRAQEVIDALRLDRDAGALIGNVQIQAFRDNLTVQIDVDLENASDAQRIANEWGNVLIRYQETENQTRRQEDRIRALLPDGATVGLLRPRPSLNAAIGGVLGFIIGAIIVFILEFLESSIIRRREDLERVLEIPVLATLPDSPK